jgi:hypothetical protein
MIVLVAVPTMAAVVAVVTLAVLGRRLEQELAGLRRSLRLAGAAAVAADELRRTSSLVADQMVTTSRQARLRLRRSGTGGRRHPR